MKRIAKQLDIYSELCPASSATVIGAGLITITMGSASTGVAFVLAGIAVGVAGPVTKSFQEHRSRTVRAPKIDMEITMKKIIDTSSNEFKSRSLLHYLIPTTLIGFGLAAAVIIAAPVGAAIATAGIILTKLS